MTTFQNALCSGTVLAVLFSLLLLAGCRPHESNVLEGIMLMELCAERYARENPDKGFPADLGEVRAGEIACLDEKYSDGREHGYLYAYSPGAPNDEGIIDSYSVTARPEDFSRPWTHSYYSDQTRILRFTEEDRSATVKDKTRLYSDSLPPPRPTEEKLSCCCRPAVIFEGCKPEEIHPAT